MRPAPPFFSPSANRLGRWPSRIQLPFPLFLPPKLLAFVCQLSFPFGRLVPLETPFLKNIFKKYFWERGKFGGEEERGGWYVVVDSMGNEPLKWAFEMQGAFCPSSTARIGGEVRLRSLSVHIPWKNNHPFWSTPPNLKRGPVVWDPPSQ